MNRLGNIASNKFRNRTPKVIYSETLELELKVISYEDKTYQLEYIRAENYDKNKLEILYSKITEKIRKDEELFGIDYYYNKARKSFQKKIWSQLIRLDLKSNEF